MRSGRFWTGISLNIGGFLTIVLYSPALTSRATLVGVVISLVCSVLWGMYVVGVRSTIGRINPLTAFAVVSLYTSVGCLVLAPLGQPSSLLRMSAGNWALLLGSGVVGIAVAHGLYYIAVQRLGAMIPSTVNTLTPFVTATASAIVFSEAIRPEQWLGGIVAALGSGFVIWSQQHLRPS